MSDVLIQTWWKTRQSTDYTLLHTHTHGWVYATPLTVANWPVSPCWLSITPRGGVLVCEKVWDDSRDIPTFFRSFPLMWQSRLVPSKHMASRRPFPNILITWAYSGKQTVQATINSSWYLDTTSEPLGKMSLTFKSWTVIQSHFWQQLFHFNQEQRKVIKCEDLTFNPHEARELLNKVSRK